MFRKLLEFFFKKTNTYIIMPDKSILKVDFKYIPDIVYLKEQNKYFYVTRKLVEIDKNKTTNWVELEDLTPKK